jgi:general stress protein YciG
VWAARGDVWEGGKGWIWEARRRAGKKTESLSQAPESWIEIGHRGTGAQPGQLPNLTEETGAAREKRGGPI